MTDNTSQKTRRRVAANTVHFNGEQMTPGVVEIEEGRVVECHPLTEETPHTEWLGGTIEIKRDNDGVARAYKNEHLIK